MSPYKCKFNTIQFQIFALLLHFSHPIYFNIHSSNIPFCINFSSLLLLHHDSYVQSGEVVYTNQLIIPAHNSLFISVLVEVSYSVKSNQNHNGNFRAKQSVHQVQLDLEIQPMRFFFNSLPFLHLQRTPSFLSFQANFAVKRYMPFRSLIAPPHFTIFNNIFFINHLSNRGNHPRKVSIRMYFPLIPFLIFFSPKL